MPVRLIAMAAILASLVAAAPAAAATKGDGGKRKRAVTLNVAVKKFSVSQRQIVGRGELTARVEDNKGASQTARRPVQLRRERPARELPHPELDPRRPAAAVRDPAG